MHNKWNICNQLCNQNEIRLMSFSFELVCFHTASICVRCCQVRWLSPPFASSSHLRCFNQSLYRRSINTYQVGGLSKAQLRVFPVSPFTLFATNRCSFLGCESLMERLCINIWMSHEWQLLYIILYKLFFAEMLLGLEMLSVRFIVF